MDCPRLMQHEEDTSMEVARIRSGAADAHARRREPGFGSPPDGAMLRSIFGACADCVAILDRGHQVSWLTGGAVGKLAPAGFMEREKRSWPDLWPETPERGGTIDPLDRCGFSAVG